MRKKTPQEVLEELLKELKQYKKHLDKPGYSPDGVTEDKSWAIDPLILAIETHKDSFDTPRSKQAIRNALRCNNIQKLREPRYTGNYPRWEKLKEKLMDIGDFLNGPKTPFWKTKGSKLLDRLHRKYDKIDPPKNPQI
ncbi:MAG: hypothetical protein Q8R79_00590 [Legionellaceae bacterium]|nr:hypothetical protein [Legionellaceae bacterium]